MLTRVQNWDTRAFHDFLLQRATAPFVWGANDCALFAADGIQVITGVDIAADFRGKYVDEAGAWETIREICGGKTSVADAAAYCAEQNGLAELEHTRCAQRGDLVVFENAEGVLVAGLVHLSGAHIVAVGEQGLYRFPISAIKRAWNV